MVLAMLLVNLFASYSLFVDHAPEYPWQPKSVLGTNMPGGGPMNTFGFPYNRDWRAIGAWFAALPSQNKIVVTNEKPVIAAFYLPSSMHYQYEWSETPDQLPNSRGLYFLVVEYPQSWQNQLWGWSVPQWRDKLTPTQSFYNPQGQPVAWVYFLTKEQRAQLFR